MQDTLEYPFRANPRTTLLAIAFFGACGLWMARNAVTNDRGVIINGLITLETGGATTLYWCMAGVCALFVIAGAIGLSGNRGRPRVVRLTPTHLVAPRNGFAREATTIPLTDIRDLGMQEIHRQRIMTIHHTGGNLSIVQSMLPGAAAFDELYGALAARLSDIHASRHAGATATPHERRG